MSIAIEVSKALTDDLRRSPWKGMDNPLAGHCYVASEAAWHLLGGRDSQWKPSFIKHEGASHWYLRNIENGRILDITASQFEELPDYSKGIGKGFLTKEPSRRSQIVIKRVGGQR